MNARMGIAALGLAGVLLGCNNKDDNKDISVVNEDNGELARPEGCVDVRDIRIESGHAATYYQLLCTNAQNELTLYYKRKDFSYEPKDDTWHEVQVK